MPADSPRPLHKGRPRTEAEIAAAARAAVERAGLTQAEIADRLGVKQNTVSAALGYLDNPKNRNRGHEIRRRILAELDGLDFAGPYFIPVAVNEIPPGYFAPGETPFPLTRGGRRSERSSQKGSAP